MAAVESRSAEAPAPAGLEELVAVLLELHELHAPTRAGEQLWEPSRLCRCGPTAIPIADDEWFGPAWLRCLKCGRDVVQLEQIGDEVYPYFADDPDRCAFPNDGRMEVEPS